MVHETININGLRSAEEGIEGVGGKWLKSAQREWEAMVKVSTEGVGGNG